MYQVPYQTPQGPSLDLSESEAFLARPQARRAKEGRCCRRTGPRVFYFLCVVTNVLLAAALLYKFSKSELTTQTASDASHVVPAGKDSLRASLACKCLISQLWTFAKSVRK